MDRFDFVVIGAGAAGEAAANMARERGASVAIVDRDLVGGSCSFWACIPSKSLLHSAAVHAGGGDYPWPRAAARRDYNINRIDIPYPDDAFHVQRLEDVGAVIVRGTARLDGPGRVVVTHDDVTHELEGTHVVVAVGSESRIPDLPGLDQITYWTNKRGHLRQRAAREPPRPGWRADRRGAGPGLCPLRRAGDVGRVQPRILARDHPKNSAILHRALEARRSDDPYRRQGGPGPPRRRRASGPHEVALSDGSRVGGHAVMFAIGRAFPLEGLGLESVGVRRRERTRHTR